VAVVATLALSACGASAEETWPGPPDPAADGSVVVDGFAAHQESVDEPWEGSTALAAAKFLALADRLAALKSIQAGSKEDEEGEMVTVVLDGLPDDAVRAERWTLAFEPSTDGFRLTAASRELRCQTGHGHESFSPEPCS
jgi:hypothetical protein